MTTKRKAPKATEAPAENQTIEALADQLRALNVDPGWVLFAALEGEKLAKGRAPTDALRADPRALYAPSVLETLVRAALECRMPRFGGKADADGLLTEVSVGPTTKAQAVILAASSALRSAHPAIDGARRLLNATETLRLALEVQAKADELSEELPLDFQPVKRALELIARKRSTTASALRKRLQLARAAFPGDDWPKKRARRL